MSPEEARVYSFLFLSDPCLLIDEGDIKGLGAAILSRSSGVNAIGIDGDWEAVPGAVPGGEHHSICVFLRPFDPRFMFADPGEANDYIVSADIGHMEALFVLMILDLHFSIGNSTDASSLDRLAIDGIRGAWGNFCGGNVLGVDQRLVNEHGGGSRVVESKGGDCDVVELYVDVHLEGSFQVFLHSFWHGSIDSIDSQRRIDGRGRGRHGICGHIEEWGIKVLLDRD
jgi:hypothetical protein